MLSMMPTRIETVSFFFNLFKCRSGFISTEYKLIDPFTAFVDANLTKEMKLSFEQME